MDSAYRRKLEARIDAVFAAHSNLTNHRKTLPWLIGALGEPTSGLWFLAEKPSLRGAEQSAQPGGGPFTHEAQWTASRSDQLFRDLLFKYGFKASPPDEPNGWRCYVTNVFKDTAYAKEWRGSPTEQKQDALKAWLPVLQWELVTCRPTLIALLGNKVSDYVRALRRLGLSLPEVVTMRHPSHLLYPGRGRQGPMHPERVASYEAEFASLARRWRETPTA